MSIQRTNDVRAITATLIAANDYIEKNGVSSPDIEKLIAQQFRGYAARVGSRIVYNVLEGLMMLPHNAHYAHIPDLLRPIHNKYRSFQPFQANLITFGLQDPADISLLIKEGQTYRESNSAIVADFGTKVRLSVEAHAQTFEGSPDSAYVASCRALRKEALRRYNEDSAARNSTFAGDIEAGFANGARNLFAKKSSYELICLYDRDKTSCPVTDALANIIENPSSPAAYQSARSALRDIYGMVIASSPLEGLDYIETIARDRTERGVKRLAARQAIDQSFQEHLPWRVIKAVFPRYYDKKTSAAPS